MPSTSCAFARRGGLLLLAALSLAACRPADPPPPAPAAAPPAEPPPGPSVLPPRPILPADRDTPRRRTLADLRKAEQSGDAATAARLNAALSAETLLSVHQVEKAWRAYRDPDTGLVPRNLRDQFWSASDTAGDCFPFLLLASHDLAPDAWPDWLRIIDRERKLSGVLPQVIHFQPTRLVPGTLGEQLFAASEYAKDGLLNVAENLGRGPWFDRMTELVDAVITQAPIATPRGPIPGIDTEINGNLLILCSRLYWATRQERYLQMAERLADVYLLDLMPKTDHLPVLYWDFTNHRPTRHSHANTVKYRDHGNETIFGLAEHFYLQARLGRPRGAALREPMQRFLDQVVVVGRTPEGLWYDYFDRRRGTAKDRIADSWGYLCNALQAFDLAAGTNRYAGEIQRAMRAAAAMKSYKWERETPDGFADAIEGMLYQLPWFDLPEARAWVDDEMEVMLGFQQPGGAVEGRYLDGNYIRTALLYARYKTQGARVQPWRADVRLGAARAADGSLVLHLEADAPWSGQLALDRPRHRDCMGLPANYPRLNAPPEWFTVDAAADVRVRDLDAGSELSVAGRSLQEGWPVTLDGHTPRRFSIAAVQK